MIVMPIILIVLSLIRCAPLLLFERSTVLFAQFEDIATSDEKYHHREKQNDNSQIHLHILRYLRQLNTFAGVLGCLKGTHSQWRERHQVPR